MKKVTFYQAKDGSTHATPKLCAEHDQKLLLAPAAAVFVAGLDSSVPGVSSDDSDNLVVYVDDLAHFIVANADALRKVLTEPLIVRRPRKAKELKGELKPKAAKPTKHEVAKAISMIEEDELEAAVAALNAE